MHFTKILYLHEYRCMYVCVHMPTRTYVWVCAGVCVYVYV